MYLGNWNLEGNVCAPCSNKTTTVIVTLDMDKRILIYKIIETCVQIEIGTLVDRYRLLVTMCELGAEIVLL